MNISRPNPNSPIYQRYNNMLNDKINAAMIWLAERNIECAWNIWIDNHLYRLYIPIKDVLLDFECYPVNNYGYNYIRINYDTDIIDVLEQLFPETILDTKDLTVWKLTQRYANKFFRQNRTSPVYDKNVMHLAWVKDQIIYQCITIKGNEIIRNVVKKNCKVTFGTYMLLRYLTEMLGFKEVIIKESTGDSYVNTMYQLIGTSVISQTTKKKIWWNPQGAKWHIKTEDTDKYIPFYYCEYKTYRYKLLP